MNRLSGLFNEKIIAFLILVLMLASVPLGIYMKVSGITLTSVAAREVDRKWSFQAHKGYMDGLAADRSGIYFLNENKLYALDSNGKKKWVFNTVRDFEVRDGNVFALGEGRISVLNSKGAETAGFAVDSSADKLSIAKDGTLCAYVEDGLFSVVDAGGKQLWKSSVSGGRNALFDKDNAVLITSSGPDEKQQRLAPPNDHIINLTSINRIRAFRPSGEKKWEHVVDGEIDDGPVLGKNGAILYLYNFDGKETMLCSLTASGTVEWRAKLKGYTHFSGVGQDGTIYVHDENGELSALSPNGKKMWSLQLIGESAIATAEDGTIYSANTDLAFAHPNWLYAIKPNGEILWKRKAGRDVLTGIAIDTSGTVYIGRSNEVYAVGQQ